MSFLALCLRTTTFTQFFSLLLSRISPPCRAFGSTLTSRNICLIRTHSGLKTLPMGRDKERRIRPINIGVDMGRASQHEDVVW
ncbi:uncharacterized protein EV420DRAFT_1525197 [Desarmillaria tabescens]|uniref:Secreted protein n=1 Tax=Armillaria tabescens TaxID=1929756 RepID=A0AA39NBB4_ARMTA|nr:uncharacterized protein EV420DRAFT_1525197 [Desarmillaria tabescens]KAK0462496.1 hypothetical protein EV420DRAFT_1525197 [Desarmillaria tabescens]